MSAQQLLTRTLANILFFLKRKEFESSKLRFLVFTGTVGKTTLRDTVTYALKNVGVSIQSNRLAYSNELGILLTIFGHSELSLKNPLAWLSLLKSELPKEGFISIELGADFYRDIKWFLKRFSPFAVFISGIADESWSRDIKDVVKERVILLRAVPRSGFIFYNLDDYATVDLVQKSNISAQVVSFSLNKDTGAQVALDEWSKNLFRQNASKAFDLDEKIAFSIGRDRFELSLHRPIFEPQVYGILATFAFIQKLFSDRVDQLTKVFKEYRFLEDRLQIFKAQNGALIIEDSYKATPLCAYWFLGMAANISAKSKILVITEMRPVTLNVEYFYSRLADKIKFADQVYFVGPNRHLNLLRNRHPHIKHLDKASYGSVAKEILKRSSHGDAIFLKGSFRYELDKLRKLLI